jgi:hypothetical protein
MSTTVPFAPLLLAAVAAGVGAWVARIERRTEDQRWVDELARRDRR